MNKKKQEDYLTNDLRKLFDDAKPEASHLTDDSEEWFRNEDKKWNTTLDGTDRRIAKGVTDLN